MCSARVPDGHIVVRAAQRRAAEGPSLSGLKRDELRVTVGLHAKGGGVKELFSKESMKETSSVVALRWAPTAALRFLAWSAAEQEVFLSLPQQVLGGLTPQLLLPSQE